MPCLLQMWIKCVFTVACDTKNRAAISGLLRCWPTTRRLAARSGLSWSSPYSVGGPRRGLGPSPGGYQLDGERQAGQAPAAGAHGLGAVTAELEFKPSMRPPWAVVVGGPTDSGLIGQAGSEWCSIRSIDNLFPERLRHALRDAAMLLTHDQ